MKQFVLLLFLAPVLAAGGELLRYEQSLDAMGTTFVVAAYGDDRNRLSAGVEASFEEVRRLDRMLSNYRPDSEWSEVNRYAAERPVKVREEVFRLLAACQEYSRLSGGTFDITVGPLMKVWGFYKGSGRLPHRAEVRGALTRVGYQKVLLNPADLTVQFSRSGVELDPGGIGKGYAVDRMVEILKEAGITKALISAGTSTMYALGAPPDNSQGWPVSIRHPKDESKPGFEVYLRNESMSTSGNYEKFFWADGRMYSHIMDPRTGYPAEGVLSVSVIAPEALDSEAWTKPFYIRGRQWAARQKPQGFRVYLCEDRGIRSEPSCALLP
jgi:thiamine biosynthesis lipoprotein